MAKIKKCVVCGKKFKVVIDHPSVIYCSYKCGKEKD